MLTREVSEAYTAFTEGRDPDLPELPVQYADFAAWQRAWLSGDVLEAQLGWWRERLSGAPPVLELPVDRPRPATRDGRAASTAFALPAETSRALRALARREGATLFMTLLAGWQLLLSRWSGQEDVSVGSPIAGRTRLELEGLIGFFVNTLVLRTELGGDPSSGELLGRVRETTLGAYQHQEIPFERLVEELAPERSLVHTPLFQVLFVLQNAERGELRMGGVEVEALGGGGSGAAKFDLMLALAESGDEVVGSITYRTELWDAATIGRMGTHLRLLLAGMAAEPGRRVSEIELLDAAERAQVVEVWNATEAAYPEELCLHDLFEAQAARTPDAPAVRWEGGELSYAALDARAERLAASLRARGVGPDVRVGVCLERGPEMMVGVLGILKAGGAYVPLDPKYPAERLAYMLGSSGARVVVAQPETTERLPESGGEVVLVGTPHPRPLPHKGGGEHGVSPDNLAYVIYTSGSTGRPKGVAMPHRPLVSLLAWQAREWRGSAGAVTLQFATLSFDVSCQEIFSAWSTGGSVVLIAEETRYDPAGLLEVVEREGVERLFLPCVALQQLAEAADARGAVPSRLREVVTAGEALRVTEPMRRWFGALGAPLYNHYGPSETHVVTSYALEGSAGEWPLLPSIGGPVSNARCYVLDGGLRPAPVGVPGELYLGGRVAGAGVPGEGGSDGGALRGGPALLHRGSADVPDGGPGAVGGGGEAGVPGAGGRPGEGAGIPDRAGGDRGGAGGARCGAGGGGGGAGGRAGGAAAGGVRGGGGGGGGGDGGAAGVAEGAASGVPGAGSAGGAGGDAADAEREGGAPGAPRAGRGGARHRSTSPPGPPERRCWRGSSPGC